MRPLSGPSVLLCLALALPNLGCSVPTRRGGPGTATNPNPNSQMVIYVMDVNAPAPTDGSTNADVADGGTATGGSTAGTGTSSGTSNTTATSSAAATTTAPVITSLQELQVTIISATPQLIVGQAYDPTVSSTATATPLAVELLPAGGSSPGAPLFRTVANQDIPEASRKGSGFKMDISTLSPRLNAGDRVAVRAWSADQSRSQISDITTLAAGTGTTATTGTTGSDTAADTADTTETTTQTATNTGTTANTTGTSTALDITSVPGNTTNFAALGAAAGLSAEEVAKLPARDLCFLQQRILMGALVTYDKAHAQRPADFTLQTLVKEGLLLSLFEDPGQGTGTSNHYIIDPSGVSGITCTVHGSGVANSTTGGALGGTF
jgi:hypothetical protein